MPPWEEIHQKHQADIIKEAMGMLEQKYQDVLIRFHYEDMSHDQIADALCISSGTVKTWMFRGRIKLQELLQRAHVEAC